MHQAFHLSEQSSCSRAPELPGQTGHNNIWAELSANQWSRPQPGPPGEAGRLFEQGIYGGARNTIHLFGHLSLCEPEINISISPTQTYPFEGVPAPNVPPVWETNYINPETPANTQPPADSQIGGNPQPPADGQIAGNPQLPVDSGTGINAKVSTDGQGGDGHSGQEAVPSMPILDEKEFKTEALKVFDELDKDGTGKVSLDQMVDAIENDKSIQGQDAIALAGMYEVARKRESTFKSHPATLTRKELQNLPEDCKTHLNNYHELRQIVDSTDISAQAAVNGGRISQAQVQAEFGEQAGRDYARLASHFADSMHLDPSEKEQIKENGLTRDELLKVESLEHFSYSEAATLKTTLIGANASLSNEGDGHLYANDDNPDSSIKADDVEQGRAGDCYFDSVLSSVAGSNPELIRDAIHENDDGSYTVTFPGDPAHPMRVPAPTDSELALYNHATKDGIWANVMEKAYADHRILFGDRSQHDDTSEDAIAGGLPIQAFHLLTGHYIAFHPVSTSQTNQSDGDSAPVALDMNELASCVADGGYGFIGTQRNPDVSKVGLAPGHCYSVVGYEPGPDGGKYELRNPWGEQSKKDGDYFCISGDQLAKSITAVSLSPAINGPDIVGNSGQTSGGS